MTFRKNIEPASSVQARPRFEELAAEISATLVRTSDADVLTSVESVLARIGEFFGLDRVTLWEYRAAEASVRLLKRWAAADVDELPELMPEEHYPWALPRLLGGEPLVFSDRDELPPEAARDKQTFERLGTRSNLSIPLRISDAVVGVLSLGVVRGRRDWSDVPARQLRLVGDSITHALARRASYAELRSSEERYRDFVANSSEGIWCMEFGEPLPLDLPAEVAVEEIFRRAVMVETNDAFARMYGYESAEEMGTWSMTDRLDEDSGTTRATLLAAVRAGYRIQDLESTEIHHDGTARVFLNNLSPQFEDGKLVRIWGTQRDVTAVRAGEERMRQRDAELRSLRDQLTHVSRRTTMGELAAAIAHELNQPLTAIGSNAAAARRFLAAAEPDLTEIRQILADIGADDRRAARVIRRMRMLLTDRETRSDPLDLNRAVRQVVELLHSDAILRHVVVGLDLDEELPAASGDAVQVQQVLMNLILNGCQAMAEVPQGSRRLTVATAREDGGEIRVSVRDRGTGFRGTPPQELFTPFRSRKEGGMGMGLAICRSIVEAHGGRIWGCEDPDRGVTFHFTLPVHPSG